MSVCTAAEQHQEREREMGNFSAFRRSASLFFGSSRERERGLARKRLLESTSPEPTKREAQWWLWW